jgi:hypothetical protein
MVNKHPIQPLIRDEHGTVRFKENAIVRFLLDNGQHNMSTLARSQFSQEDQEQFAQLIGYSLCGFCDLSYVSDEAKDAAEAMERPCDGVCDECGQPAIKIIKDAASIPHRFCEAHWKEHVSICGNDGKPYGF